ncbi:hypothetical protein EBR96_08380, partial [bacterium]|nr:hypothetical protein [bacterium]
QRYLKLLRTHHIGTRQTAYDCLETWGWRPVSRAMAQYTVMIIIPPDPTPKLYRLVQAISAGADLTIGVVITNEPDTLPVDHLLPGWDIAISQSVTIPTPDSATRLAPVEWWTAETAQSQYDTVARFIHDATKTHPLSDIGIVLPSLEYHAVDVIQKLTQLGVPVYSPIPISLSETWPGCLASAILNIIRSRADIESVSNWLNLLTFRAKTSISSRDVAQLKSIAKSTSIPLDFDRWPDLLRHPKIPESLSRILTEILPGLARGKVTAFSTIMDHLKSQFSSSEWDPETALAIGSVLNLVGELRRLVPSESIETVAEIGLKAINSVSFSAPEYGNGIQVCSLTQAATIPLPIWIWLDAIDSRWPSPSILETRLGTSVCNAMGISVGDQRYREWEKHCRSLLRQAQEKTIIISPTELDGECHSPSYLIESAVLDLNLSTTRHHCLPDQAALISRTLTEDRGNVDTWPDAAPYQNQISSETVGLLIQNRLEHSTSVSTLEQYQRCPYQYLLNRLLKLGQPPIEDNDTTAREAGIIVHNAMETLIRLLSNAKGDAPETRIQNAIQWLETGFLTQISALRPSPIASAIHRRWVGTLQNPGPVRQL